VFGVSTLRVAHYFILTHHACRRVEAEKRKQEGAIAAFKELLQRSALKPSSSWRKVSAKLQDDEAYEVGPRVLQQIKQQHSFVCVETSGHHAALFVRWSNT
jgi:anti-sigma factor RsiW